MRLEKSKIENIIKNNETNKNKAFERKIEQGKVTFDHQGNLIDVRGVNAKKLPAEYKKVMDHN